MSDDLSPIEEPRMDPRELAGQKIMTISDLIFNLFTEVCTKDPTVNTQIMHGALQYTLVRLEAQIAKMYGKEMIERYKKSLALIPKQDIKAFLELDTAKVDKC